MRYLTIAIMALLMMAASAPANPHAGDRFKGEVSVEVVSENGSTFLFIPYKDFWEGGTHIIKQYLEARRGENYGIVIRNMTPERIGVVIAVDGRNIISGKKSDLKNNEAMYIVNGYDYGEYEGWRTSDDRVHQFYFTDVADSYAMRTFSDSSAMGVIAVAVYREKERPQPVHEQERRDYIYPSAPAPGIAPNGKTGAARNESAGTGFGDEQYSPTVRVAFEPETAPVQKTLLKYEWRETLCRKGIIDCRRDSRNRLWDEDAYAPFPPGYRRY
jgi:hypothetical protein